MPSFLLAHSLRRVRALVLTMGWLLAGFQILLSLAARTVQQSNAFGQLVNLVPDYLRQIMGPSLISLMSFSGIVCVGYFHIAVIGALLGLVISLGTEPAAEIEAHFADMILSRPIHRHWLITRSTILILGCTLFLLAAMALGTSIGLYWLAPVTLIGPTFKLVRSLIPNLAALMFCWGGLTLAFSSFARRRAVPGAIAGLLALTSYLFDYVARLWSPAAKIAWIFPFNYYSGFNIISSSGIPWRDIAVLIGFGLFGLGVAYFQFSRRDL